MQGAAIKTTDAVDTTAVKSAAAAEVYIVDSIWRCPRMNCPRQSCGSHY